MLNIFVPTTSPSILSDSSRVLLVTSSIPSNPLIVAMSVKLISVTSRPSSKVALFPKKVGILKFCTKSETLVLAAKTFGEVPSFDGSVSSTCSLLRPRIEESFSEPTTFCKKPLDDKKVNPRDRMKKIPKKITANLVFLNKGPVSLFSKSWMICFSSMVIALLSYFNSFGLVTLLVDPPLFSVILLFDFSFKMSLPTFFSPTFEEFVFLSWVVFFTDVFNAFLFWISAPVVFFISSNSFFSSLTRSNL